jgi:hypothetical protein
MRSSFLRGLPLLACLTGVSAALWGCPGTLADPAEFADALGSGPQTGSEAGTDGDTACTAAAAAAVPTTIFQQTCAVAGCHAAASSAGASAEGLDFASPGLPARLINIPSMEDPASDLISSADPASSFILIKLTEAKPPGGGSQMPFGETPLSPLQIACVAAWIGSAVGADGGGVATGVTDGGIAPVTDGGLGDALQAANEAGGANSAQTAIDGGGSAPNN